MLNDSETPATADIKARLRHQLLTLRTQLSPSISELEPRLRRTLLDWERFQAASRVLCYTPFRGEINLLPLMALTPDKAWYLPVVTETSDSLTRNMTFYRYRCGAPLRKGRYDILEPITEESPATEAFGCCQSGDLMLTPGIAFDRNGYRLGYGKGYYDRFLSAAARQGKVPCTVGVLPHALLQTALPADPWDVRMNFLLSEQGIQAAHPE